MNSFFKCSTKAHRLSERALAGAEVVATASSLFDATAAIPARFSQVIVSGCSMFNRNLKTNERLMHGLQCFISASNVALLTMQSLSNDNCCSDVSTLCQLHLFSQLAYQGTLIASWTLAELKKEQNNIADNQNDEKINLPEYNSTAD